MRYSIEFTVGAERELAALQKRDQLRIAKRIDSLATTPRPSGCKRLEGSQPFYRIRVRDFRVIYSIEDRKLLILVLRIGNRRDIYR
jgi:mRNA interferase RelE/StbE